MLFLFLSPEFVRLFADKNYWGGINLIPLIVLSIFFTFLYSFGVNFELYLRKTKWIAIGTTAAAVVNIVLNALLIPKYELCGAAIATLISYVLLFVFHQLCARKMQDELQYPYGILFFIKPIGIILMAVILFYIVQNLLIIRWGIAAIVGVYLVWNIVKNKSIF